MAKIVEIRKATKANPAINHNLDQLKTIRVAAYVRVSKDSDEQIISFHNQIDEWNKRIKENASYELVNIYEDEGITGTTDKHRDGFKDMINDAKAGKIDLILVKSISRFARNVVLSLATIRELKDIGVGVYFDNEHLDSLDPKNEMTFAILSSVAQEESRHISENVNWTIQKKMREGYPFCNTKRFLGYDKNEDGTELIVNLAEAETVKLIFDLYESGNGCSKIAHALEKRGIPAPGGGTKWHGSTVTNMLKNEKYVGDLILQKTYTANYLGHIRKMNHGEMDQPHITDDHEPIISREQFARVQEKLKANALRLRGKDYDPSKYSRRYPLSGMMICVKCGATYKRHTNTSNPNYIKHVYLCNNYVPEDKTITKCEGKPLSEKVTLQTCCDVINKLYLGKSKLFNKMTELIKKGLSTDKFKIDEKRKNEQKERLSEELDRLYEDRLAATSLEGKEKIEKRCEIVRKQYDHVSNEILNIQNMEAKSVETKERMGKILSMLGKKAITPEILTGEMTSALFYRIIVCSAHEIVFVIDATHTMSLDELISKRREITNREPIYQSELTDNDPKPTTIKYKVVLV